MSRDIKPEHSASAVNKAGEKVRFNNATESDFAIIDNWRAAHSHILNSWQATLRGRCKKSATKVIFAQRLKRKNTIFDKLKNRESKMKLSRMHDIAGCRLIFDDIQSLTIFREQLLHSSFHNHKRRYEEEETYRYNYIDRPQSSGYRGIHDIYEYHARADRDDSWDGLLVEIQYRTIYQHAWATAVEVAGNITGNHAKFDQGDEQHKEFFRLTSEIIARAHEGHSSCRPEFSDKQLVEQYKALEAEIGLFQRLSILKVFGQDQTRKWSNIILHFKQIDESERIYLHSYKNLPEATFQYFNLEREYPNDDLVLVRATDMHSVKNAFRNYFSDAKHFVALVNSGIKKLS